MPIGMFVRYRVSLLSHRKRCLRLRPFFTTSNAFLVLNGSRQFAFLLNTLNAAGRPAARPFARVPPAAPLLPVVYVPYSTVFPTPPAKGVSYRYVPQRTRRLTPPVRVRCNRPRRARHGARTAGHETRGRAKRSPWSCAEAVRLEARGPSSRPPAPRTSVVVRRKLPDRHPSDNPAPLVCRKSTRSARQNLPGTQPPTSDPTTR
ncbi:Hypothetical protein CINCED_3A013077 [Cinara cedri]|uniref:Uncharacterized protein n=1 Tax=Cinara cedri TaxID=506608 RepID=A0A5E4MK67_9HEMI|nr:Hypothetical protein CINCED_3A013077 [Cinara cedri]